MPDVCIATSRSHADLFIFLERSAAALLLGQPDRNVDWSERRRIAVEWESNGGRIDVKS